MTWVEAVFVPEAGCYCETFCSACGQLRLWCKPELPKACGGCGSPKFVTGPVGGEDLLRQRAEWRRLRPNPSHPCLNVLEADGGLAGRTCWEPATYYARGDEARYGHVCGDCWQGFVEAERELYALADGFGPLEGSRGTVTSERSRAPRRPAR